MQSLYELEEAPDQQTIRATKKCRFCAEIIQYEAIKCRFCKEFLNGQGPIRSPQAPPVKKKWGQSTGAVILAFLTVGPLAIPLVWMNRRYSLAVKIGITCVILGLTVGLGWAVYHTMTNTLNQIKSLGL